MQELREKDPRAFDDLNNQAGEAFARCGRRKALRYALSETRIGSSKTRVHQIATGDATGWLQRASQAIHALGANRSTTPYPAIRHLLEVAERGRVAGMTASELCQRILTESAPAETTAQAEEDNSERDLLTAIWPIVFQGIDQMGPKKRAEVAAHIRRYMEAAANEVDRQLEVMGDAAALLEQIER